MSEEGMREKSWRQALLSASTIVLSELTIWMLGAVALQGIALSLRPREIPLLSTYGMVVCGCVIGPGVGSYVSNKLWRISWSQAVLSFLCVVGSNVMLVGPMYLAFANKESPTSGIALVDFLFGGVSKWFAGYRGMIPIEAIVWLSVVFVVALACVRWAGARELRNTAV